MNKHDLPAKLSGIWPKLKHNYTVAAAAMHLAYANQDDDREDRCDAHTEALDAILLTPAECMADVRLKIEIMDREEIDDSWWCGREALALLAIDARRLLPTLREGRGS
jgi:hypothetical protein